MSTPKGNAVQLLKCCNVNNLPKACIGAKMAVVR